jgi:protein-S-isoprenylcysteine O-methyltransferase Ste14
MTTRVPKLGARGEGWVLLQIVLFWLIAAAGYVELKGQSDLAGVRELAGALVAAAGVAIAIWSARSLRRALTPFPMPVPGNELVENGPYGRVRHPIYSGVVVAALGWSLLCGSWVATALCLVLAVLFDAKSRREEAWLSEAHPEYSAYRRRTRRFVPGVY